MKRDGEIEEGKKYFDSPQKSASAAAVIEGFPSSFLSPRGRRNWERVGRLHRPTNSADLIIPECAYKQNMGAYFVLLPPPLFFPHQIFSSSSLFSGKSEGVFGERRKYAFPSLLRRSRAQNEEAKIPSSSHIPTYSLFQKNQIPISNGF